MSLNQTYDRYEHSFPEDKIVTLSQLCRTCTCFVETSSLIQNLFSGRAIQLGALEQLELCSPEQLKAGYLGGCHFCALVWTHAQGYLFDPSKPAVELPLIRLCVAARDLEKEYELQNREPGFVEGWRMRIWPASIGVGGFVEIYIPKIRGVRQDPVSLYLYPSDDQRLNKATFKFTSEPISTRHDSKLSQANSWFQECVGNHSKCREFAQLIAPTKELPSRLLHLDGDKLRLECDVQNITSLEYTTLSHMWGPDPTACLSLKEANLAEFQSDIPLTELPIKYTDAIRITKSLGYRYLWIDSLCIIQDSTADWKREALKMAAVYGGAACNISHTQPPTQDESNSHLRDPRLHLPCKIKRSTTQPTTWMQFIKAQFSPPPSPPRESLILQHRPGFLSGFWSPNSYQQAWPLLSRAWVFQERLLCPRNIYYGHNRLIWECCESTFDEFYGQLHNNPRSKERWHSVFSGVYRSETRLRGFFEDSTALRFDVDCTLQEQWDLLVQEYRSKKLTYETDRVIAFAGIVKAVRTQAQVTYLAGLWREFADLQLLWSINESPGSQKLYKEKKKMKSPSAPTWSWFSVPVLEVLPGQDVLDFRIPRTVSANWLYAVYQARVISYHHGKAVSDPESLLYDFAGLSITLRTHRIDTVLEWDGDSIRLQRLKEYELPDQDCWIHYVHDDKAVSPGSSLPNNACMILTVLEAWETIVGGGQRKLDGQDTQEHEGPPINRTCWLYAGLVILPEKTSFYAGSSWRRIGVFLVSVSVIGKASFTTPFQIQDSEEEDVHLV